VVAGRQSPKASEVIADIDRQRHHQMLWAEAVPTPLRRCLTHAPLDHFWDCSAH
jgi:hypothetical protein